MCKCIFLMVEILHLSSLRICVSLRGADSSFPVVSRSEKGFLLGTQLSHEEVCAALALWKTRLESSDQSKLDVGVPSV